MNQRCEVTGSNGFIGSKLVERLEQDGCFVTRSVREDTVPASWSISPGTDVLIHCAAYMPANFSCFSQATKCLMDNGLATLNLLKSADKAGVKTFIYLSSGQIYAWKDDPSIEALETDVMDPITRSSPYLISKLVADCYVRSHKTKMRIVVLRLSSVYGAKSHGLLDRLVTMINQNNNVMPNYNVDLVHVDDVVAMIGNSITNEQISGTYNVGGGHTTSTFEILRQLSSIMKKPCNTNAVPLLESGHAGLNIEKAKNVGYKPRSLKEGLSLYVNLHETNI